MNSIENKSQVFHHNSHYIRKKIIYYQTVEHGICITTKESFHALNYFFREIQIGFKRDKSNFQSESYRLKNKSFEIQILDIK
jgi:hypothetical protein